MMVPSPLPPTRADLPPKHPINRAARIAKLVLADAKQAISCHTCFVAANAEVYAPSRTASHTPTPITLVVLFRNIAATSCPPRRDGWATRLP